MAFQIPGINSLFTIIVLAGAIIAIILILLLLKLYQVKSAARAGSGAKITPLPPPARAPTAPQKQTEEPGLTLPQPVTGVPEPLTDQGDIGRNLEELVHKYGLDSFTLTGTDGLLIASTSSEGPDEAANYSQMWNSAQTPADPGVRIFGMAHHGSTIVGIIRSSREIPMVRLKALKMM